MLAFRLFNVSCIVLMFTTVVWCNCPSQKRSRKSQRSRLLKLSKEEVVVEGSYNGVYNNTYWFMIEQVWTQNHGNLKRHDSIYIDPSTSSFQSCFQRLDWGFSYILMLKFVSSSNNTLFSIEPPVLSSKKKFRQFVWNHLCALPGNDASSCDMRITFPEQNVYFQGQIKRLECKVESSSPVIDVQWFKDDSRIETNIEVNLVLNTRAKDFSILTFNKASHIHRGSYKCLVRNKAGQMKFASTTVDVIGPISWTRPNCDDSQFCLNGGKCQILINGIRRCECPKTHEGERCGISRNDFLVSENKSQGGLKEVQIELFHVTTALTALAITLAFVVIFSLICITRLRSKLSSMKDLFHADGEGDAQGYNTSEVPYDTRHGGNCVKNNENPRIQISINEPSQPIEFRPVRVFSDDTSIYTSNGELQRGEVTPRTILSSPSFQHSNGNLLLTGSITPCSMSPSVRRERLNGKS